MNQTVLTPELVSALDSALWKALVIACIWAGVTIFTSILNVYFEIRRLKLIMKGDPRGLAIEYMRLLRDFAMEYGYILKRTQVQKPAYIVFKKKLSDLFSYENMHKVFLFLLVILLILLLSIWLGW